MSSDEREGALAETQKQFQEVGLTWYSSETDCLTSRGEAEHYIGYPHSSFGAEWRPPWLSPVNPLVLSFYRPKPCHFCPAPKPHAMLA